MLKLCEKLANYQILCPDKPRMAIPERMSLNTRVENSLSLPSHLWEQFLFPRTNKTSVHLSLIGTAPFVRLPYVNAMVVHDVNFHLIPESFDWRFRAWYRFACGRAAKVADAVFVVSEYTKRTLVEYASVDPEKVFVFNQGPGLPVELLTGERLPTTDRPFILCVGSLQPHKNLAGVLQAFDALRQECRCEHQLVVVGKKQNHFNSPRIDSKYLNDPDIQFTGYVSDEQLTHLYRQADVFVYPSFEEGFGMPLVEAFYAKCPVITSNRSCLPEISGDAAMLVSPNDSVAIADAIQRVLTDAELRQDLVRRGSLRAQRYQWESAAKTVYDQLLLLGA